MGNSTEAVTSAVMKLALDGAALRHQALASNIANAQTPGYSPLRTSFEQEVARARDRLRDGEGVQSVVADAAPALEAEEGAAPAPLDMQVADLAQNVVQYQALLRGWSKRMAILSAAINEGKR